MCWSWQRRLLYRAHNGGLETSEEDTRSSWTELAYLSGTLPSISVTRRLGVRTNALRVPMWHILSPHMCLFLLARTLRPTQYLLFLPSTLVKLFSSFLGLVHHDSVPTHSPTHRSFRGTCEVECADARRNGRDVGDTWVLFLKRDSVLSTITTVHEPYRSFHNLAPYIEHLMPVQR